VKGARRRQEPSPALNVRVGFPLICISTVPRGCSRPPRWDACAIPIARRRGSRCMACCSETAGPEDALPSGVPATFQLPAGWPTGHDYFREARGAGAAVGGPSQRYRFRARRLQSSSPTLVAPSAKTGKCRGLVSAPSTVLVPAESSCTGRSLSSLVSDVTRRVLCDASACARVPHPAGSGHLPEGAGMVGIGRAHCCARPSSEPGRAAFTASGSSKS